MTGLSCGFYPHNTSLIEITIRPCAGVVFPDACEAIAAPVRASTITTVLQNRRLVRPDADFQLALVAVASQRRM